MTAARHSAQGEARDVKHSELEPYIFPVMPGAAGIDFAGQDISEDEWRRMGERLGVIERAARWYIGDWLAYGEAKWGERYDLAMEVTGLSYSTLRDCKWVAEHVHLSRRRDILTWSHHREVAKLPAREQTQWLKRAEKGDGEKPWTRKELRREIRDHVDKDEEGEIAWVDEVGDALSHFSHRLNDFDRDFPKDQALRLWEVYDLHARRWRKIMEDTEQL